MHILLPWDTVDIIRKKDFHCSLNHLLTMVMTSAPQWKFCTFEAIFKDHIASDMVTVQGCMLGVTECILTLPS